MSTHTSPILQLNPDVHHETSMREIIYLQAGNVSNYIGTHFFNTCESYFTYGDGKDEAAGQIDHDVSFREGIAPDGQPTFCPRLLLFDEKGMYSVAEMTEAH